MCVLITPKAEINVFLKCFLHTAGPLFWGLSVCWKKFHKISIFFPLRCGFRKLHFFMILARYVRLFSSTLTEL